MPTSTRTFPDLGVPAILCAELDRQGITLPFPIQAATLPDTLAGKDVLGRGKTGSGKTLAFSLPLVARLAGGTRHARQARSLILVPTRELANQVMAVVQPLAYASKLTAAVVFGGVGQSPQVKAMAPGVDVLIACPGRLEDLISQGFVDLSAVEITILDEADHMADLGFLPAVKRLLDKTPKKGQRMLFSATLDNGVDVLVKRYLHEPTTHSVDPAVAPVSTMTHYVFSVSTPDKPTVVRELASGMERSVLFMRTKHTAKKLAKQLTAAGVPAVELHGNLSQGARERNLEAFMDGSVRVLVATDIAARGIHVDDVAIVIHVDPPTEHKAYLHRSGRTARAGAGGVVVTLSLPEQGRDVKALAKQAGIAPETVQVRPGHPLITQLVGPAAPHVEPVAEVPVQQQRPPRQRPGTAQKSSNRGRSQKQTESAPKKVRGAGTGAPRTSALRAPKTHEASTPEAREATRAAAGQPSASTPARKGPRRAGAAQGPARTRAELAARAGQQPPSRRPR
ncbi:MAG: rhlE [Frankiales bacterium]|nr:rhlE [Frankiales bacterium]